VNTCIFTNDTYASILGQLVKSYNLQNFTQ